MVEQNCVLWVHVEIRIQFKPSKLKGLFDEDLPPNELVLRVQPNEAVYLKMLTKKPGSCALFVFGAGRMWG